MSDIYEIINSLGLEEAEANKLKIYLITNHETRKELTSALAVSCGTEESKRNLLKDFLHNIPGMLDKIFALYTVCDAITKPFFVLYHVPVDLDEHQARTKIKIMDEFPNGLQFIKPKPLLYCTGSEWIYQPAKTLYEECWHRNAEEFHKTAIACFSEVEDLELRNKIENAFVFSVGFENGNSLICGVEQSAYRSSTRMLKQLLPNQDLDLIILIMKHR
ncbi:13206_t:CDS:2 [Funneliformis caledonium]|uniref:13206_t:CDS:1 n=1 Tax=Funneliformis caledonium TaxID=1117310 RepID=A0A9N9BZQ5_9GLOM|nr:13206_t:CDS:2 [Funneliformis caledonium]